MPLERIEISVSATGKIPRRNFENYSPMFVVKETWNVGGEPLIGGLGAVDEWRQGRQKELYASCEALFTKIREELQLEELQDQYRNLRFSLNPANGKKYPHVTDILFWDSEFYISREELAQYGARGAAIHAMIDWWIAKKKWDPGVISKRDAILLETGSLRLIDTLEKINFLGFMEKHGADMELGEGEFLGFNDEHFYCGSPDRVGKYQGKPALFDWKCREAKLDDFKQMAMYANLEHPALREIRNGGLMVIVPLNPENKSGFGRPVVSDEIEKYFSLAMKDRKDFRDKFGI